MPLRGEIHLDGAKNAALPALAATLLADHGEVRLDNVPRVADIGTMSRLLQHLGAEIETEGTTVRFNTKDLPCQEAPYDLVRKMRASVLVLGPLLARYGCAKVSFPGGCAIGARPIDLHLAGLEAMGARITLHGGYVEAHADYLKGADIHLKIPTVTGTENIMMAATLAQGNTRIMNAAREPEIVDLSRFLTAMGARIRGAGSEHIEIEGVSSLKGASHQIIADRVETATYAVAAAITGGDLLLHGASEENISSVIQKMESAGAAFASEPGALRVSSNGRLQGTDISTAAYPGFPTDVQAQFMAMMCLASGTSRIREDVFENRFMHVAELRRMGAIIRCNGPVAEIQGVSSLGGAPVMATDLRASASLVLAGLAAGGETIVSRIYHLDRGYNALEKKLAGVGARIRRVKG